MLANFGDDWKSSSEVTKRTDTHTNWQTNIPTFFYRSIECTRLSSAQSKGVDFALKLYLLMSSQPQVYRKRAERQPFMGAIMETRSGTGNHRCFWALRIRRFSFCGARAKLHRKVATFKPYSNPRSLAPASKLHGWFGMRTLGQIRVQGGNRSKVVTIACPETLDWVGLW